MSSATQAIETGHGDMIHDAQLDYYGRRLATCSSDRSIKIFEIGDDGQQQVIPSAVLNGHEGPVWQVAWAHPKFGTLLASVGYDRKLIIWKEAAQHQWIKLYEYAQHDLSVNSVAWAPHEIGLMVACGSSDGSISILAYNEAGAQWTPTKIDAAHPVGVNSVSWAPALPPGFLLGSVPAGAASAVAGGSSDAGAANGAAGSMNQAGGAAGAAQGAAAVGVSGNEPLGFVQRLASGGCDNLVKIWQFNAADQSWHCEHELSEHKDWVRDVSWAPSAGLPVAQLASCSQDGSVIVWSAGSKAGTSGAPSGSSTDASGAADASGAGAGAGADSISATGGGAAGNANGADEAGGPAADSASAGAAGPSSTTNASSSAAAAASSSSSSSRSFIATHLPKFPDVVWRVSWSLTGAILAVAAGDGKVTLFKDNGDKWESISSLDKEK